ncbi:GTP-binding protein HflX [Desulfosporosinus acidiphilus SJ4]|uniref:GTPase HflX n=1 Tax=Desulfosporosinus acidiphilus (strain DSM 22704 / JCM 16185 / SJ4) TaxID=646529 RepID=I4D7N9_DESAJ|nr:GTPase HflX [Desulfosporosinus acidiphilus]AFM41813.1 GTP-binding protein HflX [Desulfosporosinus acidiphilus SJ4]
MEISGDLSGIKASQLRDLKKLSEYQTGRDDLIHPEILSGLIRLTQLWNREICIYLSRSGLLIASAVGKHATVTLLPLKGRSQSKHLRCLHTHPNGVPRLSSLDFSALTSLKLESMTAIGVLRGELTGFQLAYLTSDGSPYVVDLKPDNWNKFNYFESQQEHYHNHNSQIKLESKPDKERAFLLALQDGEQEVSENLEELAELADTAGVEVVGQLVQPRRSSQSRSFIGSGKLEELVHRIQETRADVLISDDELSPSQLRTLEMETGLKILDRTGLILDIFAQRAHSREGKLQVELAQLKHLLPYLTGQGQTLSRLGGGIGSRGPGETKLELDRRRMRQRINLLDKELKLVLQHREIQRRQRAKSGLPMIALVGYTNAGKTTFMKNAMEQAGFRSDIPSGENKLFATLDPIVRRIKLTPSLEILLSDTVGFIRKLPTQLLKAFLATLEEVQQADILIHVLDVSHPQALQQAETVHEILGQLECHDKPVITLLNKVDKVHDDEEISRIAQLLPYSIPLSLKRGDSLAPIWNVLESLLE